MVGLQLPRGTEIVIAALAVWQAGGAYLPIDTAYPADRIAHMLADAAPVLVLDECAIAAVDPTLPSGPLAVGERTGLRARTTPRTSSTPPDRRVSRRVSSYRTVASSICWRHSADGRSDRRTTVGGGSC